MLKRLDLRGMSLTRAELAAKLPRATVDIDAALESVRPIIERVRAEGGTVLRELGERFDGVRPEYLRVPQEAIDDAEARLSPELRHALQLSIEHNRAGHRAQLPREGRTEIVPGGFVFQRWIPVERVGLYVPGGLAVYPSSVIHNAVAAQVAGVQQIALASPPQKGFGGLPHPTILAACKLLGITEVYAVGGAQAIAMFAYGAAGEAGTADDAVLCEPVDVVTGPGNIYVAAAKRAVHGVVGIDAEAGTTEIAIIADSGANPRFVAADLLSQAEHDPAAASVLITDSPEFADACDRLLEEMAAQTKHSQRVATALAGPQSGVVIVDDHDEAIRVANAYAAEHLEIHTANAAEDAKLIRNAGAIFVGPYTPVPLGDYMAGSNHVLPTGATARFAAGLNVMAYIKSVQEIEYGADAMASMLAPLTALAMDEDLPAHANALKVRTQE
ncbi:histidinol dehydrogenase [Trueperella pecoris]|uniref:Histidinol dehydrogenase n=1 Tax=Trueperella pecoris TaxID=2733571 RepID=A0A7M1QTV4_9ACTO|nr:histidinol dehydrogenase [Trueperella pecoris]QOQ38714.1 histidinol dehydrogenase [Trueperella pecoris]QOR44795.1 histidinol dehydrogenase [Trueperella pecoris]QTG74718.1 histidinol dehydrogenase [Trueperella pecoris]